MSNIKEQSYSNIVWIVIHAVFSQTESRYKSVYHYCAIWSNATSYSYSPTFLPFSLIAYWLQLLTSIIYCNSSMKDSFYDIFLNKEQHRLSRCETRSLIFFLILRGYSHRNLASSPFCLFKLRNVASWNIRFLFNLTGKFTRSKKRSFSDAYTYIHIYSLCMFLSDPYEVLLHLPGFVWYVSLPVYHKM